MPERTRKVPTIDMEKATTANITVQARRPSRVASTVTLCSSAVAASHGIKEARSEEHTSELQSLMRISYAVFCLKKKTTPTTILPHEASRLRLIHSQRDENHTT